MEQWLREAKDRAKDKAKDVIKELTLIADIKDIDKEWFIDEVLKNISSIRQKERKVR